MNNILKFLLEHKGSTINLSGYACVIGKQNDNQGLSQRRSDLVKIFFADGGLEAGRIISVGRGEVDPTDDKQGRDNIKYRNEYSYEQNRRVDISFVFYAHDAQTINYEVVAPSVDTKKELTINVTALEAKACFRGRDKHKKEIYIVDVGQSVDKGDTKQTFTQPSFNYKVYSDLSRFNLFPLQYIWPMSTRPNQFHLHAHTCRYFSNEKRTTVLIKAYPDIKWELAFEFLVNVSNYKAVNMPTGNIFAKHQEKSREAGYKRWRMNETGKVPISIGVGLSAEWNSGKTKRSFTNEFSDRIQLAASFIARVIGILQDVINFAQSTAKTTGIPVAFDIRYPKLTFVGKWYLERQGTTKVLGTTGEINLGLKPIIGAEVIIDILACAITALSYGLTGNPAAAKLIDKFRKGIEKIGGAVTFTGTFYGELEIEMEALKIIGGKVSIDGKTTIGGKMGVKIVLAIEVGGKFNSNKQKKIIDFRAEARLEGEAFFGGDFIINSDDKGLYYQPVIKFSGVIITGTVEGEVGWWKSNFSVEEKVMPEDSLPLEKIYITKIKKMTNFLKPLYSIYGTLYCSGSILVNDVLVIDWYGEETKGNGGYSGDVEINHTLLQSGKHKVVGKMHPRFGEKILTEEDAAMLLFYLAEADLDKWKQSRFQFHPKIESPWDGLSKNIKYPHFEIVTEIEVELPFVLDGWQNSVNLSEIKREELFKEVLNYYKQIRLVLKEHNAARYLELSQEKMKLQEQAFYFSEERKKSFLDGAAQLFAQNLEVEELDEDNLKMELIGYGKLVRLLKKDGSQALQFKSPNPENQSNIELEIKLHKRSEVKGFSVI